MQWRSLDERQRIDRAARYHREALASERQPPSLQRHAAMHVMVENQLALHDPPAVRGALARLVSEGTSRHDALHAIGWVLTTHMSRALEARKPVDVAAYVRELDELTVARWLERAGVCTQPGGAGTKQGAGSVA